MKNREREEGKNLGEIEMETTFYEGKNSGSLVAIDSKRQAKKQEVPQKAERSGFKI
jgi:hypothetical protein